MLRFLPLLLVLIARPMFGQDGVEGAGYAVRSTPTLPTDIKYFTLSPFEHWHNKPWKDSVYRFPQFEQARLVFDTGFSPSHTLMMNYNIYLETMDVMRENNEKWVMKKFPTLKYILIGDHKFLHDRSIGYLEIIQGGVISLAVHTTMTLLLEYTNGLRLTPSGVDVRTGSSPATRYYWPVETFYVVDPANKPYKVTPRLLHSMLPSMKDMIRDFEEIKKTDYRKKQDLIDIVKFCNEKIASDSTVGLAIPADSDIRHSDWRDSVYRFTSFAEASVVYGAGRRETLRAMNYNLVKQCLEVINEEGDTVRVINSDGVRLVNIDGITFLYNDKYGPIEVILQGKTALGLQKRIVFDGEFNAKLDSLVGSNIIPREKVYHLENIWFFITGSKATPATARALLSLYPKHKQEISDYITTNNIDFRSKADLLSLLTYCARY